MPDNGRLPLLARLLPLRGRLALGFVVAVGAVSVMGGLALLSVRFNTGQVERIQRYNEVLVLAGSLAESVLDMQLDADRFIFAGHESAPESFRDSYDSAFDRIDRCARTDCLALVGIDTRAYQAQLEEFAATFSEVVDSRERLLSGLDSEFDDYDAELAELARGNATLDAAVARHAAGSVAALQLHLRGYLGTGDVRYLGMVEFKLEDVRELVGRAEGSAPELLLPALERSIDASVQRIRGYNYLTRVVLAGHVEELVYLARRSSAAAREQLRALRESIEVQQSRYLELTALAGAITLAVALLLFVAVMRSIVEPLQVISAVFRRLASGSREPFTLHSAHRDELGDLILAAEAFRDENIELATMVDRYSTLNASLEAKVAKRTEELAQRNQDLLRLASTDPLTGVANRRAAQEQLTQDVLRAQRYDRTVAVMLMDIDHFKRINDTFGHQVGDMVLQEFGARVHGTVRATDLFGRWGGEEFLLICPESSIEDARVLAEKIRREVLGAPFAEEVPVTVSIGVAVSQPQESDDALVARADGALYRAKAEGRNRVCIASSEPR